VASSVTAVARVLNARSMDCARTGVADSAVMEPREIEPIGQQSIGQGE
jgi:hypothetical protein